MTNKKLLKKFIFYYLLFIGLFAGCGKYPSNALIITPQKLDKPTQTNRIDDSIDIHWNYVDTAKSYRLYWSYDSNLTPENVTIIDNVNSPFIFEPHYGKTVYVKISALDDEEGLESDIIILNFPPVSPQSLNGSANIDKNMLTWSEVENSEKYYIYRSENTDFTAAEKIAETTNLNFEDTEVQIFSSLNYWITAVRLNTESEPSQVINLITPWEVSIDEQPDNSINVSWTTSTLATSYDVHWSFSPIFSEDSINIFSDVSSPFNIPMQSAQTIHIKVIALDEQIIRTSEILRFGFTPTPQPPQMLAGYSSVGKNHLNWLASEYADTYHIYVATENEQFTLAQKIGETTDLNFIHENVEPIVVKTYWVTAVHLENESQPSNSYELETAFYENYFPVPLNDTGVTKFIDENNELDLDAVPFAILHDIEPVDFPGQDASHGRDVSNPDNFDGRAGFSFTKLHRISGDALAENELEFGCVQDNITGLVWENKTNPLLQDLSEYHKLHNSRDRYSWFDPNSYTNGGDAGEHFTESICSGLVGDTSSFVKAVNNEQLCGFTDWRVPTIEEFRSIIDYSVTESTFVNPTLDKNYFPYSADADHRWTSQSSPSDASKAFGFHLYEGRAQAHSKRCESSFSFHNGVMLVRGGR